jgi:ADP-ribosylglycohydrolase
MLGAIIGDIVGSVYEFRNYRAKDFDPLFHPRAFYTDDTICTVAVAEALIKNAHPGRTLKDWGRRYWGNGGWGRQFRLWLRSESLDPYGSYGNGAAMRVSPAGFLGTTLEEATRFAVVVTEVTHNHPEGIRGACATTTAIFLARYGHLPEEIRAFITAKFGYDLSATSDQIRPNYRFDESCQGTVPQALICALEATSFEDAIRTAISIGGDSDTIGAIAGAVAEARFGIPKEIADRAWSYLPNDMKVVVKSFYAEARQRHDESVQRPSMHTTDGYRIWQRPRRAIILEHLDGQSYGEEREVAVLAQFDGEHLELAQAPQKRIELDREYLDDSYFHFEQGYTSHLLGTTAFTGRLDEVAVYPMMGGLWKVDWLAEQGIAIRTDRTVEEGWSWPIMKLSPSFYKSCVELLEIPDAESNH